MAQLPTRYGEAPLFPAGGYDPSSAAAASASFFNQMHFDPRSTEETPPTGNQRNIEDDKNSIYSHPLYPCLDMIFKKVCLATFAGESSSVVSCASLKEDFETFINGVHEQKTYYVPNPQLDDLMLQAITMLRFHLLELEKVHELCDNFCSRYVSCLKEKLPYDIVGEERASSSAASAHSPGGGAAVSSPSINTPINNHYQAPYEPQTVPLPENTSAMSQHSIEPLAGSSHGYPPQTMPPPDSGHPLAMDGSGMTAIPGHTSHNNHAAISPSVSSAGGARNGSTPCYDSGSHLHPNPASTESAETGERNRFGAPSFLSSAMEYTTLNPYSSCNEDGGENFYSSLSSSMPLTSCSPLEAEGLSPSGKSPSSSCSSFQLHPADPSQSERGRSRVQLSAKKRGIFPKAATNTMRHWLFKHLTHPYPSEEQKKQLATDTGLTILQVNNWFINARRRIVQPMIDQNNRAGRQPAVNVFKNRRRKDSEESSPEGSSAANGAASVGAASIGASTGIPENSTYSPESLMPPMNMYSHELYMRGASSMFSPFPPYNQAAATAAMAANSGMFMPQMGMNMFNQTTGPLSSSWPLSAMDTLSTAHMD